MRNRNRYHKRGSEIKIEISQSINKYENQIGQNHGRQENVQFHKIHSPMDEEIFFIV